MRRITITIDPTGAAKLETTGFKGRACKDATKAIEEAMGATTKDTPTREMHQTESNANRNKARG